MGLAAPCRRRRWLLLFSVVFALMCVADGTITTTSAAASGITRSRRLWSVATNDYDIPRANPGHQPTTKAKPKPKPKPKPIPKPKTKPKPKPNVIPVKQKQKRN